MATGKLAGNTMASATYTEIYTCPAGNFAVVTVNVVNKSASTRQVRLTVSDAFPPTANDYIEYDTTILANGVLERTGIVLAAGQKISSRSSGTDTTVVVYGIETPTV
jgi:hypothetical protein